MEQAFRTPTQRPTSPKLKKSTNALHASSQTTIPWNTVKQKKNSHSSTGPHSKKLDSTTNSLSCTKSRTTLSKPPQSTFSPTPGSHSISTSPSQPSTPTFTPSTPAPSVSGTNSHPPQKHPTPSPASAQLSRKT